MAQDNIQTKTGRARLEPRDAPYYMTLSAGCALGFRRGPETWIARCRIGKKQHWQPLGELAEWDDAKKAAEAWFKTMGGAATTQPTRGTAREALAAYVADLRDEQQRAAAAMRAEKMFARCIYADPFADLQVEALKQEHFKELRKRLAATRGRGRAYPDEQKQQVLQRLRDGAPLKALARETNIDAGTLRAWKRDDGKAQKTGRSVKSVNRIMRQLYAALNAAVSSLGYVGNPLAWKLKRVKETNKRASDSEPRVIVTPEQRADLVAQADDPTARFIRGLWYANGPRPGELAETLVSDFDPRAGTITFRDMKGDSDEIRVRVTPLSTEAIGFFKQCAKGKFPQLPLVHDRTPDEFFKPHRWANGINKAIAAVNAGRSRADANYIPDAEPKKVSAYSWRHAFITEALQVYQLDPITVCKITGTSLEMLHKHYWHLIAERVRSVLDSIKVATA